MRGISHDEYMVKRFRAEPEFAADLLNDILTDGDDQGELKSLLELIAMAGLEVGPVSIAPKPKAKPRAARARVGAAKKTSRGQKKAKTTKSAPRRSRVRASAAAAIA